MMLVKETNDERTIVQLSRDELHILNNALNEVCNGIDLFEFETRIGASKSRVNDLLKEINLALAPLK